MFHLCGASAFTCTLCWSGRGEVYVHQLWQAAPLRSVPHLPLLTIHVRSLTYILAEEEEKFLSPLANRISHSNRSKKKKLLEKKNSLDHIKKLQNFPKEIHEKKRCGPQQKAKRTLDLLQHSCNVCATTYAYKLSRPDSSPPILIQLIYYTLQTSRLFWLPHV